MSCLPGSHCCLMKLDDTAHHQLQKILPPFILHGCQSSTVLDNFPMTCSQPTSRAFATVEQSQLGSLGVSYGLVVRHEEHLQCTVYSPRGSWDTRRLSVCARKKRCPNMNAKLSTLWNGMRLLHLTSSHYLMPIAQLCFDAGSKSWHPT